MKEENIRRHGWLFSFIMLVLFTLHRRLDEVCFDQLGSKQDKRTEQQTLAAVLL